MRSFRTGVAYLPASLAATTSRHRADVRQLRQSGDDVADGVDAGLGGLHPLVGEDEAAVGLDLHLVEACVGGARGAADGDQDLLRLLCCGLPFASVKLTDAVLVLLDFLVLAAEVDVDAALLVRAAVNPCEISSSSTGTMRGSTSMMVTSAPKLLKTEANSTPTAPEPMTISDFGSAGSFRIS